jgi:hypothetical protein
MAMHHGSLVQREYNLPQLKRLPRQQQQQQQRQPDAQTPAVQLCMRAMRLSRRH